MPEAACILLPETRKPSSVQAHSPFHCGNRTGPDLPSRVKCRKVPSRHWKSQVPFELESSSGASHPAKPRLYEPLKVPVPQVSFMSPATCATATPEIVPEPSYLGSSLVKSAVQLPLCVPPKMSARTFFRESMPARRSNSSATLVALSAFAVRCRAENVPVALHVESTERSPVTPNNLYQGRLFSRGFSRWFNWSISTSSS